MKEKVDVIGIHIEEFVIVITIHLIFDRGKE